MGDSKDQLRRRIIDTCLLMESDLAYPHTTETLAEYAGLSLTYFKHSFKKIVGETAIAHLTRLRMSRAAIVLKNSELAITQIALETGFSTNASFTNAFRRLYGCSPTEYRKQQTVRPYMSLPSLGMLRSDPAALAKCPLTVQIRRDPTPRIAMMRHVGSMASMPGVWLKMMDWCRSHSLVDANSKFLGIHHDDWDENDPDGHEGYRYDAAVVIDASVEVDDAVNTTFIPGGEIAIVSFDGSLSKLDKTWKTFVYEWLPASGYQPRLSFVFDTYDPSIVSKSKLGILLKTLRGIKGQLCVPVTQKPIALSQPD